MTTVKLNPIHPTCPSIYMKKFSPKMHENWPLSCINATSCLNLIAIQLRSYLKCHGLILRQDWSGRRTFTRRSRQFLFGSTCRSDKHRILGLVRSGSKNKPMRFFKKTTGDAFRRCTHQSVYKISLQNVFHNQFGHSNKFSCSNIQLAFLKPQSEENGEILKDHLKKRWETDQVSSSPSFREFIFSSYDWSNCNP